LVKFDEDELAGTKKERPFKSLKVLISSANLADKFLRMAKLKPAN